MEQEKHTRQGWFNLYTEITNKMNAEPLMPFKEPAKYADMRKAQDYYLERAYKGWDGVIRIDDKEWLNEIV